MRGASAWGTAATEGDEAGCGGAGLAGSTRSGAGEGADAVVVTAGATVVGEDGGDADSAAGCERPSAPRGTPGPLPRYDESAQAGGSNAAHGA